MAPPKYKDLGKKANDILNEDFKFEQTFELKSKLNGMEVKSTFADKGKGVTGNMELKRGVAALGDVTLKTDHSFASPQVVVENSSLVKGLKVKVEAPVMPGQLASSGLTISPEFKHDLVMFTAKAETKKASCQVDAVCVAGPATAGVKAKVDAKGGLSGIEACAEVQTAAVTVAAKYDVSKGGISGSLHTGVNDSTAVAVSMTAGGDLTLGANYTIDKDSNVKAKVDKTGLISLFYMQKVRKDLTLKVSAAIDSQKLSGANAHKWGLQALMTM